MYANLLAATVNDLVVAATSQNDTLQSGGPVLNLILILTESISPL